MLDQVIDQIGWDGYETVNRIIYYFLLIQDANLKTQKLLFLMTIERRNKFKEQFITKFT